MSQSQKSDDKIGNRKSPKLEIEKVQSVQEQSSQSTETPRWILLLKLTNLWQTGGLTLQIAQSMRCKFEMRNFTAFLLTILATVGRSNGDDALDDAMNNALKQFNVRGASIGYFDRNKNLEPILRAYGKISSSDDAQHMTPETVIMIASISKVFAGAAVLKLVSQNIINLDDDICQVLPDDYDASACRNPAFPNTPVTWRMLVTHRSSLRPNIPSVKVDGKRYEASYGPTGGYTGGTAGGNPTCPLTDVVGFYRDFMIDKPTETSVGSGLNVDWYKTAAKTGGAWKNFKPGSRYLYSNFAVGYIAALVEYVSGQSFQEFCRVEFFEPLGMRNTAWFREDLPGGVLETQPVEYWGGKNPFEDVGHYCFIDYASGSLRTTAKDMAIFLDAMLDYGAPVLWPEETGKTAVTCAQGTNTKNCEFGVNWILMKKNKAEGWLKPAMSLDWTDAVMHDGAEVGTQTQVLLFPKAGVYAIVFTNTDGNSQLAAQKIMKEVLLKAPTLNPSTNAPVATPTTSSPVKAPSTSPPTTAPTWEGTGESCQDSPLQMIVNRSRRYCQWVAEKNKSNRCKIAGVSSHCPQTCGKCGICKDSSKRFVLRNGTKWTCKRVKRGNTSKQCKWDGVDRTCQLTCGFCA